jgi:hypothetical protein
MIGLQVANHSFLCMDRYLIGLPDYTILDGGVSLGLQCLKGGNK